MKLPSVIIGPDLGASLAVGLHSRNHGLTLALNVYGRRVRLRRTGGNWTLTNDDRDTLHPAEGVHPPMNVQHLIRNYLRTAAWMPLLDALVEWRSDVYDAPVRRFVQLMQEAFPDDGPATPDR